MIKSLTIMRSDGSFVKCYPVKRDYWEDLKRFADNEADDETLEDSYLLRFETDSGIDYEIMECCRTLDVSTIPLPGILWNKAAEIFGDNTQRKEVS
jgi:hypothetical protein